MDYKTQADTLVGVLPFFHIYGGVITLLAGLRHGVKIVTLPKFEPATFLGTLQNHQVLIAFRVCGRGNVFVVCVCMCVYVCVCVFGL